MTPEHLAQIHAAAFQQDRSWSAQEFKELLSSPLVTVISERGGFALTRLIAGEAELLTLAVDPKHQNQGIGRRLLNRWLAGDMDRAFLEVAADNAAAFHLYTGIGFQITATRRGYYRRQDAATVDALILSIDLTHGQPALSTAKNIESG